MNARSQRRRTPERTRAFTLMELLVVIAIIAIIAGLTAPAINGLRRGDAMRAALRQMLDDVAYARQRALNDHTTVYLVFIPPVTNTVVPPNWPPEAIEQFQLGQLNSYRLYVKRQAGDQPGRGTARYLTPWKTLPEGVAIAPAKYAQKGSPSTTYPTRTTTWADVSFTDPNSTNRYQIYSFEYDWFPFPDTNSTRFLYLPYLAFNYQGGLDTTLPATTSKDIIPLAKGSLLNARVPGVPPDFKEQPPGNTISNFNLVVIDRLTGRARSESRRIP